MATVCKNSLLANRIYQNVNSLCLQLGLTNKPKIPTSAKISVKQIALQIVKFSFLGCISEQLDQAHEPVYGSYCLGLSQIRLHEATRNFATSPGSKMVYGPSKVTRP